MLPKMCKNITEIHWFFFKIHTLTFCTQILSERHLAPNDRPDIAHIIQTTVATPKFMLQKYDAM